MAAGASYFITVMTADRPGIVAAVGQALALLGGNIENLSQTVMRGHFTVIVYVHTPAGVDETVLREALGAALPDSQVGVQPGEDDRRVVTGERLILTAVGRDQTGLVGALASFLAGRDINIEDMYARSEVAKDRFIMILQVVCPPDRDLRQLQLDLQELADDLEMTAHLQHENVFRATNEIGAVRTLTL